MRRTALRAALLAADLAAALSAVGGGVAVTARWIVFPAEWLDGTPFTGYTVPGLILCLVVGGSATLATIATLRGAGAASSSAVAGAVMMGWVAGEVAILGRHDAYTWLQPAYFALGLAMVVLALLTAGSETEGRKGAGEPRRAGAPGRRDAGLG